MESSNKRESEDNKMPHTSNQPEPSDRSKRLDQDERRVIEDFRTLTPENKRKAIALLRRLKASQE